LDVILQTYKKGKTGNPIRGISQLRYLLAKYNNEDEDRANEIIRELNHTLGIDVDTAASSSGSSGTTGGGDPVAQAMVRLAESNGDIFFKDMFGQPHAIINTGNHIELVSMETRKFAYHLRTLLRRNKNRRIVSKDSVEKAIETLKAEAIVEGRTIPLHLRVAWKKKNEIIYYDPTDDSWSCIAIERDIITWQMLPAGSLTGYPIAELRNPNSKLTDRPVLFTRYTQMPQVMPDRNYPHDVMQQFIDRCTNIRNPKDQLLFKAYLVTLFIPDIAHPILLLKGVKGAAKSILETEVKRIIDPSQIELLILNNNVKEFIIQLAHNYYNAYDNVIKIPKSYNTPIEVFDVKGLYPTVMILHNLSFETVCCTCCRDKPEARVQQSIMDSINEGLRNKIKSKEVYESEKRSERYWICLRNRGAIPMIISKFKQERDHHRVLGDEPMSQALKVMMNSIYGLFGSDGIFEFQDYRVAELVTAFARLKLLEMKELAKRLFAMNIIYGDTDSIFISGINEERRHELVNSFIAACKQNLEVEVDHQNTFTRSMLISKKHYIGIQLDGKVVIKGMEGKKRDRPPFFNQVFSQLIDDYRNEADLSLNILKAFKQLEVAEVDPSLLAYSVVLNKDPEEYQSHTPQHKIGISMNKEAGSLIKYYKTGQEEDGYKGYSTNYQDLNIDVYKEELWKIVRDILILQGYAIQKLEDQIFAEAVEEDVLSNTSLKIVETEEQQQKRHRRSELNVQRDESLTKYLLTTISQLCYIVTYLNYSQFFCIYLILNVNAVEYRDAAADHIVTGELYQQW
jgi:hypothetical protein